MGGKLLWCGLTLVVAVPELIAFPAAVLLGSLLMVIGAVLMLLDK